MSILPGDWKVELLDLINKTNGTAFKDTDIVFTIKEKDDATGDIAVEVTPANDSIYYRKNTVYYTRRDFEKFFLGVPLKVIVDKETTVANIVASVANKYKISFDKAVDFTEEELAKTITFEQSGVQNIVVPAADTSFAWLGNLDVRVEDGALDLANIIKVTVLDTLKYPTGVGSSSDTVEKSNLTTASLAYTPSKQVIAVVKNVAEGGFITKDANPGIIEEVLNGINASSGIGFKDTDIAANIRLRCVTAAKLNAKDGATYATLDLPEGSDFSGNIVIRWFESDITDMSMPSPESWECGDNTRNKAVGKLINVYKHTAARLKEIQDDSPLGETSEHILSKVGGREVKALIKTYARQLINTYNTSLGNIKSKEYDSLMYVLDRNYYETINSVDVDEMATSGFKIGVNCRDKEDGSVVGTINIWLTADVDETEKQITAHLHVLINSDSIVDNAILVSGEFNTSSTFNTSDYVVSE